MKTKIPTLLLLLMLATTTTLAILKANSGRKVYFWDYTEATSECLMEDVGFACHSQSESYTAPTVLSINYSRQARGITPYPNQKGF